MLLFFRTTKLQKVCNSHKEMQKTYGAARAKKLQQRLMELRAADHLGQISRVPPPRCHEMTGDRQGQLSVDLDHPYRLIFVPDNNPIPKLSSLSFTTEKGCDFLSQTKSDIHRTLISSNTRRSGFSSWMACLTSSGLPKLVFTLRSIARRRGGPLGSAFWVPK